MAVRPPQGRCHFEAAGLDEADGEAPRAGGVFRAIAGADAAAILIPGSIEAEMSRVFDIPVAAVPVQDLRRPAANRRRAGAAPAPLSVLPGGHLPASIRRTSVNLCAKDNQRLVPEYAARTSSRCLRTGAESGEREERQPSPSSFPRSRDSHRPPGDWTESMAQGLRDLGRSRAVFPDSESGSLCRNPGAGRLRPRFTLSQSRGLKPRGIQPDESSEETEAVWKNFSGEAEIIREISYERMQNTTPAQALASRCAASSRA